MQRSVPVGYSCSNLTKSSKATIAVRIRRSETAGVRRTVVQCQEGEGADGFGGWQIKTHPSDNAVTLRGKVDIYC